MISLFQPSRQGACQSAIDLIGKKEVEKIPSIEEALDAMESELVDTSINPRRPS